MEKLRQHKTPPLQLTGKRALALCGSCPLAELCAQKPIESCPQTYEGDGEGGEFNAPSVVEPRRSYKELLMDDSVPVVMAQPKLVSQKPTMKKPVAQRPIPKQPAAKVLPAKPIEKKPFRKDARIGELLGEAIADIFASMISVRGVAAATKSRKSPT